MSRRQMAQLLQETLTRAIQKLIYFLKTNRDGGPQVCCAAIHRDGACICGPGRVEDAAPRVSDTCDAGSCSGSCSLHLVE